MPILPSPRWMWSFHVNNIRTIDKPSSNTTAEQTVASIVTIVNFISLPDNTWVCLYIGP